MDLLKSLKKKLKFKQKKAWKKAKKIETVAGVQVPKKWLNDQKNKSKLKSGYVIVQRLKERKRYRLPDLRTVKRIIAFFYCIFFFLTSQTAFASIPAMGVLFLGASYLFLDYVWQLRRSPKVFKEKNEIEEKTSAK